MLSGLRVARYRFSLTNASRIELSAFVGSTLRSAFGGVFRRLVCVTRVAVCDGCLLRNQCAYGYVFETSPPTDATKLSNYKDIPRPFVIEPPLTTHHSPLTTFVPGDNFSFKLVLIGRAIDYLPYFVFVFRELEKYGLGRGRKEGQGQFQLHQVTALLPDHTESDVYDRARDQLTDVDATITEQHILARVQQLTPIPPYSHTPTLTIQFVTSTRLKFGGHLTSDFQFHHLIRALLRRLSGLMYFHCGSELDVDFRGLIQRAEKIEKISDTLRWQEQTRYSSRQKTEMQMGGFIGSATFAGDLTPFLPLLVAGEWVHVSKGAVMGLGQYRVNV
jgi:hypothetical protein